MGNFPSARFFKKPSTSHLIKFIHCQLPMTSFFTCTQCARTGPGCSFGYFRFFGFSVKLVGFYGWIPLSPSRNFIEILDFSKFARLPHGFRTLFWGHVWGLKQTSRRRLSNCFSEGFSRTETEIAAELLLPKKIVNP